MRNAAFWLTTNRRNALFLLLAPLLAGWSLDGRSPYVGGAGGNWERLGPPTVVQWTPGTEYPGDVAPPDGLRSTWSLSQIVVRSGTLVDGIEVTYRGPRNARSVVSAGGRGESLNTFTLASGERIVRITGRSHTVLNSIQFHTNRGRSSPEYGGAAGQPFSVEAPDGHFVVGLRVRAGRYIDGFEAIFAGP